MDDDFTKIISRQPEFCNGVPIEKFREIASKRYPFVTGGIYVDTKVSGGMCNAQGRIFLNSEISIDVVARFAGEVEIDNRAAAWLCFLHEVGHLALNHVRTDATPEEIQAATKRLALENLSQDEKELYAVIRLKNQSEADRWAVNEYKQLKKEGLL